MLSSTATRVALLSALLAAAAAGDRRPHAVPPAAPVQETGRALAAELGCGGCHAGVPAPDLVRGRAPTFGPGSPPLSPEFVFGYLADPVRRREDIGASRMPDFRLDEAERVALALYLAGSGSDGGRSDFLDARGRHPAADAELGGRIFAALGCAGCHGGILGTEPIEAPDLSREGARVLPGWMRAFLEDPAAIRGDGHPTLGAARMPDFRLTSEEADALAAWMEGSGTRFATMGTEPLTPHETVRTRRLLEERIACLGCHRVDGRGGRIGPSLEGIVERLDPSFVLEMVLDPGRAAPGGAMPHQPLPEREARRLARYLLDRGGSPSPVPRASLAGAGHLAGSAAPATSSAPGAELYARHCAACHGVDGRGDGWNARDLPVPPTAHADSTNIAARLDDTLFDGIAAGAWVLDGSPRMPAFGDLLSAEEIRELVRHIRTLCACSAPAWSRDGRGGGG